MQKPRRKPRFFGNIVPVPIAGESFQLSNPHRQYDLESIGQHMLNHSISADLVFSLCQSQSEFPIDFERAWEWIGYTRKDNAKRALLSCNLEEGIDFLIKEESMEGKFGTQKNILQCPLIALRCGQ
jgi:hypothetical protein